MMQQGRVTLRKKGHLVGLTFTAWPSIFARKIHVEPFMARYAVRKDPYVKKNYGDAYKEYLDYVPEREDEDERDENDRAWRADPQLSKIRDAYFKVHDGNPQNLYLPRLPGSSPETHATDCDYAKLLHLNRLEAVRDHMEEELIARKFAKELEHRDLQKLYLPIPDHPCGPHRTQWMKDGLQAAKNELTKNNNWTQKQKEDFLIAGRAMSMSVGWDLSDFPITDSWVKEDKIRLV